MACSAAAVVPGAAAASQSVRAAACAGVSQAPGAVRASVQRVSGVIRSLAARGRT